MLLIYLKILLILLFGILFPAAGSVFGGQEIWVIQSMKIDPYDEVFAGFEGAVRAPVRRLILPDAEGENLAAAIRRRWPAAIFCIGKEAFEAVRRIEAVPVFYCMVLHPFPPASPGDGVPRPALGIRMFIDPRKQLEIFLEVFPELASVGLLYHSGGQSGNAAITAAGELGINLRAVPVDGPKDVVNALESMKGRVDGFWMLPDFSVWSPETLEYLFLYSLQHRIPVLSFSKKYLEMGATMAIGIDPRYIGHQAGEMVNAFQAGGLPKSTEMVDPETVVVSVNELIVEKLGVTIDPKAILKTRTTRLNPDS